MESIDTNINNYEYDDLISILDLTDNAFKLDELFKVINEKIINISQENNYLEKSDKSELSRFFKNIFYKICHKQSWSPPNHINKYFALLDDESDTILHERPTYNGAIPRPFPRNPVVNSTFSEYSQGLVNPLKRDTITNTLIINSKFRNFPNSSTSTEFTIDVRQPINNVVSLKVASLEISNSYYNISDYLGNNTFCVWTYIRNTTTDKIVSGPFKKLITLKDGAYTVSQLTTEINSFLIDSTEPNFKIVECFFDMLKGKIVFRINLDDVPPPPANTQFEFNIYFDNTLLHEEELKLSEPKSTFNRLGFLLGYTNSAYIYKNDYCSTETNTKLIGMNPERCVDLSGTKFFLLEVDDFNKNAPAVLLYVNENFQGSDILAKIPNVSNANEIIFEDSSDNVFKTRRYFGPIDLKKLKIRLLDEYGNVLDFKNADLIITFEVQCADSPYKNIVQ